MRAMTPMEKVKQAAYNNAVWCDTVCRTHGVPGEFADAVWLNYQETPPFYPNVVTLGGERHMPAQLEAIRAVQKAAVPGGFAVKDSFAALDLAEDGFRVLFGAEWIWRSATRPLADGSTGTDRWELITTPDGLGAWETAWAGAGQEEKAPRLFLDSLLTVADVAILAASRGEQIVAGAIANRSGEVVGVSNLFVPEQGAAHFWAGCVRLVQELFPGLPLGGYGGSAALAQAQQVGFETAGPLRVWSSDGGG